MNLKALLMLFSMMCNLHTFSESFFLLWESMTSYHVTNIQKNNFQESTKHLLATILVARKSLYTSGSQYNKIWNVSGILLC